MKLLILTQIVDRNDPSLSFFHRWIETLASHFDTIIVICLKEGEHTLPSNVRVYSLGKEAGRSRVKYVTRFFGYIWTLRNDYDTVFVHMNQEYVVLGGWLWRLMGKYVTMWRNYHSGDVFTDVAAFFCNKVFCTSAFSYTARYSKTVLMPVGVDLSGFASPHAAAQPNSFLSFGRISPSKHIEVFIEALGILAKQGIQFTAHIYGDPLPKDEAYLLQLRKQVEKLGVTNEITFSPGVPNHEAPEIFSAHEIFVNASPSGMYDKAIFEAAASGCLVIASSQDWASAVSDPGLTFDGSAQSLAHAMQMLLSISENEKDHLREVSRAVVEKNSLDALAQKLTFELRAKSADTLTNRISNYKKSLMSYWPMARALSLDIFSATPLFFALLSVPLRKRFDGRTPKRLMLYLTPLRKRIPFYVRDGMDISVLREMFTDREYAFPESLSYHPKHIADIGAHIGAAALFFRTLYPEAKITAYEPVPENFALLQTNLSSLDNIECVHAAVAGTSGTVLFYPDPNASTRASLLNPGANGAGVEVPAILFEDVIASDADLVKFDVEGDEYAFLAAASKDAIEKVGLYLGEVHLKLMGKTKEEFMALFPGYAWTWHYDAIVAISRK